MEHAQYWMLMKRRQFLKPHFQVSSSENWEEKAFAEDAGSIWPPRSYTCSFCRREFRSAQALGGHMNVHRRDRAKLKQSLGHDNKVVVLHQNRNPESLKPSDTRFPCRRGAFSGLFGSDSISKTTRNKFVSSSYEDDDDGFDCKRRKIGVSTLPFLVVGVKNDVAGSMEDLDLELRLGVRPKVM